MLPMGASHATPPLCGGATPRKQARSRYFSAMNDMSAFRGMLGAALRAADESHGRRRFAAAADGALPPIAMP